jgi:hypothetical protein
MKLERTVVLAVAIGLVLCAGAAARNRGAGEAIGTGESGLAGLVEGAAMAPCVSANFGYTIGDLWFPGIYTVGISLNTGYYPGSSDNLQVYQCSPWMGGYAEGAEGGEVWTAIGTFDRLDFLRHDIRCSGFNIAQPGRSSIDLESTFDTGKSPRDLGVVTTLRYMMWSDPRFDDFVMVKVGLKFTRSVRHFWWGWMTDADVGNNSLKDYYYDDLVGYDDALGIAYMHDDDGDPAVQTDSRSTLLSPAYVGQMLLSAPPPGGAVTETPTASTSWETFTWWDWNNDITGDESAYDRLSAGTIKHYPPDQPFDYRMLTAIGPYEAEAGDSTTLYFAIVFGEGIDADFWARRAKIGGTVSSLGSLAEHAENARTLFADQMTIEDPAPLPPVLAEPLAAGKEVTLEWLSDSEEDDDFVGYRVYRSNVSNVGPWSLIRDLTATPYRNSCLDTLRIGFPTFYAVSAYDLAGNESTLGAADTKTLEGIYATTLPSDYSGDCEATCADQCQGCPECLQRCIEQCMRAKARTALDRVIVSPNPYRGSGDWERLDYEGRLAFLNLPGECEIHIYSMTGERLDVVYHNLPGDQSPDPAGNATGGESWDMLTANNQSIASGVYIYRVVSEEYGQKIGKFAVIKGDR